MTEDPHLRAVVEQLYDVFASHPLRRWTDPCLHCSATLDEEATLHAAPLRELGPTVIGRYAASAMTTWGDERDLAHFLPRILDIVATQDFSWPCVEVVFATLRHAHWHSWPEAEHAAIQDFLLAKWKHTTSQEEPPQPVDGVLCAIAQAEDDLATYLEVWQESPHPVAARHLVQFVLRSWRPMDQQHTNPFWNERPEQARHVVDWMHADAVSDLLADIATSASSDHSSDAPIALQAVSRE